MGPRERARAPLRALRARALGFPYLDSGAMYRAVGLMVQRHGGAASDRAEELEIQLGERVIANGEDVTEAIRTPEVSEAASKVATEPEGARGARARSSASCWPTATGWPRAATSAPSWLPTRR